MRINTQMDITLLLSLFATSRVQDELTAIDISKFVISRMDTTVATVKEPSYMANLAAQPD